MRDPWIIAHRGASGHAPENTLAAFERAVHLGAGFIETDLQLTRDGRFVAFHDETLERTTNGRGAVHDYTLAELRELDAGRWFDRQFEGQRIPTLEEVLDFAGTHDVVLYLEIKYSAAWGMHHALAAALQRPEYAARSIVISFDPATLRAVRQADPTIVFGLLIDQRRLDPVRDAQDVGARQLCLRADLVTAKVVEKAHRASLQVAAWTLNDLAGMRTVVGFGVDGVMTDLPDRLRALIEDPMIQDA
jgi:glycerophosphoryl diester phosphodiesterase